MEDCGGEGTIEEEEEQEGQQQIDDGTEQQTPDDKDRWVGKELPPTTNN
jgi:hypothetical protein